MSATHDTLPHSLDAERATLGALLVDNALWLDAADAVSPEEFYREAHRILFAAMLRLAGEGRPVDLVTLPDALGADLERVGGLAYISRLVDGIPRTTNVGYYARIVRQHARRRALIAASYSFAEQAQREDDIDAVHTHAEDTLRRLQLRGGTDTFVDGPAIAERALRRMEQWQLPGTSGLSTGLRALDEATCGLHPSQLVIIAGRPGMGKSTLADQIAAHVAIDLQQRVAVFSLEMDVEEVGTRIVCARAGVPFRRVQRGQANASEMWRIGQESGRLAESPLMVEDAHAMDVAEIRRLCRRRHAVGPLSLVVIDYLTLLSGVAGVAVLLCPRAEQLVLHGRESHYHAVLRGPAEIVIRHARASSCPHRRPVSHRARARGPRLTGELVNAAERGGPARDTEVGAHTHERRSDLCGLE